ncbi:MAG: hypothetical protein IPK19_07525 [Chloroflexi bacterium]|nr:hypothetical protein [Chloroflexota bacterium]
MLKEDLEVTRMRGYALDRQEHELETYCIGAPIFDQHGTPIGACSISGRDSQIVANRMFELGAEVTRVAGEISRRMGYVPARPSQVRRGMKG